MPFCFFFDISMSLFFFLLLPVSGLGPLRGRADRCRCRFVLVKRKTKDQRRSNWRRRDKPWNAVPKFCVRAIERPKTLARPRSAFSIVFGFCVSFAFPFRLVFVSFFVSASTFCRRTQLGNGPPKQPSNTKQN